MKNIHILSALFAAAAFACTGCPSNKLPPEPAYVVYPPFQDAAPPSDTACTPTALCRTACESLAKVGCPESAPAGQTCSCMCTMAEAEGLDLNLICVSNASTVEQIRACGPRCLGR